MYHFRHDGLNISMENIPPLFQELSGLLFIQTWLRLALIIKSYIPWLRGSNEVNDSDVMAITNNKMIKILEKM